MRLRRVSLVFLSSFLILLLIPFQQVYAAFNYTTLNQEGDFATGLANNSWCIHTATGRLVKVVFKDYSYFSYGGADNIIVYVLNNVGTLLASTEIDVTPSSNRKALQASITTFNSTCVIIFIVENYHVDWHYGVVLFVILYNVISFTYSTKYTELFYESSTNYIKAGLSPIFKYGNYYYVVGLSSGSSLDSMYRWLGRYNPSTNTINYYDKTAFAHHLNNTYIIAGFQDFNFNTDGRYAYVMYTETHSFTPVVARVDFESNDIETIAALGVYGWDNRRESIQYIASGCGTYQDGEDYYLYMTWFRNSNTSAASWHAAYQWRLRFNSSTLTAGNLQDQNYRLRLWSIVDITKPMWIWGYCPDKSTLHYWALNYLPETGILVPFETELRITDWTDFETESWDELESIAQGADLFPYISYYDVIGREVDSPYQVNEYPSWGLTARVYYGLEEYEVANYDISISYTPADSPMVSDKYYKFTATGTRNGLGFKHVQFWYLDGNNIGSKTTSTGGISQLSIKFAAGTHNLTVEMYSLTDSTLLYNETWRYVVIQSPTVSPEGGAIVIPHVVGIITQGVPILIIFLAPIMALAEVKGLPPIIAITIGVALGAIVGVMSGIIQIYQFFLIVLSLIVALVYMMRK